MTRPVRRVPARNQRLARSGSAWADRRRASCGGREMWTSTARSPTATSRAPRDRATPCEARPDRRAGAARSADRSPSRSARPACHRPTRRAAPEAVAEKLSSAGITVDTGAREAWVDGKPVELTGLEIDSADRAAPARRSVVPRTALLDLAGRGERRGRRARSRRPHLAAPQEARRRSAHADPDRARRWLRAGTRRTGRVMTDDG